MNKRKLGSTGIEVFPIAFGGIPIQRVEEEEAVKIIKRAIELGIDLIDTARAYSNSEAKIGKALKGVNKRVYIASKSQAKDKETILKDIETSLNQLGVNKIDIYQLHAVNDKAAFDKVMAPGGALEGLKEAKERGLIEHIGVSTHSLDFAEKLMETGEFEVIQIAYNFIETDCEKKILKMAQERGIGVIGMKPFGGGVIENAKIALKYVLRQGYVIPDPGMQSIEEVEGNIAIALGSYDLTEEELQEIERIKKDLGSVFCRRCEYCQPCPQGVQIPAILRTKDFMKRLPPERLVTGWFYEAYLSGKNCIKCGVCISKCPYNLPIPDLVEKNIQVFEEFLEDLKQKSNL